MRKLRLSLGLLRFAARFVDYEAASLPVDSRPTEYGYVLGRLMGLPKGRVLDVGCIARHNYVIPSLCFAGWDTFGIDVRPEWSFKHPNFTYVQKDMRENDFTSEWFDVMVCISTLEHIGLAGRYSIVKSAKDGDMHALKEMYRTLKKGGRLLLTVPYSINYAAKPDGRIYDADRLNRILGRFSIVDKTIYALVNSIWTPVDNDPEGEGVICLELTK